MLKCPWCKKWEGKPKDFEEHLKVCPKNPIKEKSTISQYSPGVQQKFKDLEERKGFENVVSEQIDSTGNICSPLAKSPVKEYEACTLNQHDSSEPPCIAYVLMDLVVAEKVARRQYDELLQISGPGGIPLAVIQGPAIKHIRDEEHEHEQTLTRILANMGYNVSEERHLGGVPFYKLSKI